MDYHQFKNKAFLQTTRAGNPPLHYEVNGWSLENRAKLKARYHPESTFKRPRGNILLLISYSYPSCTPASPTSPGIALTLSAYGMAPYSAYGRAPIFCLWKGPIFCLWNGPHFLPMHANAYVPVDKDQAYSRSLDLDWYRHCYLVHKSLLY